MYARQSSQCEAVMGCDPKLSDALHTMGYIEAITRFCGKNRTTCSPSNEDYVGRITALFAPLIPPDISERKFDEAQRELKKIVTELRGDKQ